MRVRVESFPGSAFLCYAVYDDGGGNEHMNLFFETMRPAPGKKVCFMGIVPELLSLSVVNEKPRVWALFLCL